LVLTLYDLLRDEPVFVDWYLKTYDGDMSRFFRRQQPRGAFWSRSLVNIVIGLALALSGVGLIVTVPVGLYILWKFNSDQSRYRAWRERVDALAYQIGLSEALALVRRAPKVGGISQFLQYAKEIGTQAHTGHKRGHHR
jgi:hypothetical protein